MPSFGRTSMPTSVSPPASPVMATLVSMVLGEPTLKPISRLSSERPSTTGAAAPRSAMPRMPSLTPSAPMSVVGALAAARLTPYRLRAPPTVATIYPIFVRASMSKPFAAPMLTPSGTGLARVPSFGGFWVYKVELAPSMPYSVVEPVPANELVYAEAEIALLAAPPLMLPSVVVAPLSTLMRRLWPVLLTMRRRSAIGLKSTPKLVPAREVNGSVVSAASAARRDLLVAAPVAASSVYRRPVEPTPYSMPSAGRTSMPTRFSPLCRPVTSTLLRMVPGVARSNETRRLPAVRATTSPTVAAGGGGVVGGVAA